MIPTERALLDAIIAKPADDTVRLVYADWLDENGQPARGEFIRVQIEAERHHRHSARRAALDSRAHTLLQEHWIDWWLPVCEAVGLPSPKRPVKARRYEVKDNVIQITLPDYELSGFECVEFRRGFPQIPGLNFAGHGSECGAFLRKWPSAGPFTGMCAIHPVMDQWAGLDGPHFNRVHSLDLWTLQPEVVFAVFDSPHFTSLEDVWMRVGMTGKLQALTKRPRAACLRRLGLVIMCRAEAEELAAASAFEGLTGLEVYFSYEPMDYAGSRLDEKLLILAASPHFQGLRDLELNWQMTPDALREACSVGHWKQVRRLTVVFDEADVRSPIHLPDLGHLPVLEDLDLSFVPLDTGLVTSLPQSPLLKQLRHFTLRIPRQPDRTTPDLGFLAEVLDPIRIETLAVQVDEIDPATVAELRQTFGERLRLLST